jgi:hypothetical protein
MALVGKLEPQTTRNEISLLDATALPRAPWPPPVSARNVFPGLEHFAYLFARSHYVSQLEEVSPALAPDEIRLQ